MRGAGEAVRRRIPCLVLAALAAACSASAPPGASSPVAEQSRPPVPPPVRPLAEATTGAPRITVQVTSVERAAAEAVIVKFLLVNPDAVSPVSVGSLFAGSPREEGSLSGVCLADDSMRKRYFVLRDDRDQPLCTTGLREIPPGARVEAWSRLAAPPAAVKQVTVQVPGLPPFRDLPIAEPPAGTGPGRASY